MTITSHDLDTATFFAQIETTNKTTIGNLQKLEMVNLEHPLRLSDRLGGHLVQGHVDGIVEVLDVQELPDGSIKVEFQILPELEKFVVQHGSICLNGVSLTVSDKSEGRFSVALIPATIANTTFANVGLGDHLNVEVDCLARYVEQLLPK